MQIKNIFFFEYFSTILQLYIHVCWSKQDEITYVSLLINHNLDAFSCCWPSQQSLRLLKLQSTISRQFEDLRGAVPLPIIIRACYAGIRHAQLNYGLVSTSDLIVTGFGRAVLRPHNRRGPRAPDSDDALGRRDGGGATDLSPVSAGTALLALELQVRGGCLDWFINGSLC